MKKILIILSAFFCILYVSSCYSDKTPIFVDPNDCDPNLVYFQSEVLPILSSNCAQSGCHDAITEADGYNFTDYAGAYAAIKPYNAERSELYESITTTESEEIMPPAGNTPLSAAQIEIIRNWIEQGGQDFVCNNSGATCDTANMSYANNILPIIQTNCNGCHSGSEPSGGYDYTTYGGILGSIESGKLYNAILQNGDAVPMPPSFSLTACEIKKVKAWIDNGYPNN